jgi:hypothetical protein
VLVITGCRVATPVHAEAAAGRRQHSRSILRVRDGLLRQGASHARLSPRHTTEAGMFIQEGQSDRRARVSHQLSSRVPSPSPTLGAWLRVNEVDM